ncbi:MAG: amidohydrolase [Promicromonosporaceae bacterium]|nr:amidohydrolase [Promicromonosporaceae bacterium]
MRRTSKAPCASIAKWLSCAVLSCLAMGACAVPENVTLLDTTLAAVDIYFSGGTVFTADSANPLAEAVAIRDGEIVFVGSAAEGERYRAQATEIIDLNGGMLLPGLIDAHIHSLSPAIFDVVVGSDFTPEEIAAAIRGYLTENPSTDAIYGFGFNVGTFDGVEAVHGPSKARLDAISQNVPIIMYALDGHTIWMNSAAFEYCEITADTASPPGGEITLDPSTGELWGTLVNSAMSLVPDPAPVDLTDKVGEFVNQLSELGYTGMFTVPANGTFAVPFAAYQELADRGDLNLWVRGAVVVKPWSVAEDIANLAEKATEYPEGQVAVSAAKFFADGIMGSRTAYLLGPYEGESEYRGEPDWTVAELAKAYQQVADLGLTPHTHAIGDAAVQYALDATALAGLDASSGHPGSSLTHLQLVAESDFPRFAELEVAPVLQPYWFFKQPGAWWPIEQPVLGERAEREWPAASFISAGAHPAFSSDYPVTTVPLPFFAIEIAVTRNLPDAATYGVDHDISGIDDPEFLLWPEQRVTVQDALRAFTINAAETLGIADVTGSIEVGKSADLVWIDQDLLNVEPLSISDTSVLATYFQGRPVFLAPR